MVLEKYAQWLPGATLCRPKHSKRLVPKSIELGIVLPKLYPADIGVTAERIVADALARQLIKEWSRMTKVFIPKELEINTAKGRSGSIRWPANAKPARRPALARPAISTKTQPS